MFFRTPWLVFLHVCTLWNVHYGDVIMDAIASQITSLTIVYSIVYSDADQRKHQSSASLAFVRGIHGGPVNSPHKWPVTRKMFPFDDVIMYCFWHIRTDNIVGASGIIEVFEWKNNFVQRFAWHVIIMMGLKLIHVSGRSAWCRVSINSQRGTWLEFIWRTYITYETGSFSLELPLIEFKMWQPFKCLMYM